MSKHAPPVPPDPHSQFHQLLFSPSVTSRSENTSSGFIFRREDPSGDNKSCPDEPKTTGDGCRSLEARILLRQQTREGLLVDEVPEVESRIAACRRTTPIRLLTITHFAVGTLRTRRNCSGSPHRLIQNMMMGSSNWWHVVPAYMEWQVVWLREGPV